MDDNNNSNNAIDFESAWSSSTNDSPTHSITGEQQKEHQHNRNKNLNKKHYDNE